METPTGLVEGAPKRARRFRMTTRWMMTLVLSVAGFLGSFNCLRSHVREWEARRAEMYRQRDVTAAIIVEASDVIAMAGRIASESRQESEGKSYTRHWRERIEIWEVRRGRFPLIRATISGSNGEFSLDPITVETYGSPLDDAWLERLLRVYREHGWTFRLVRSPAP